MELANAHTFRQLLDEVSHNERSPPPRILTETHFFPRPPLLPAPIDNPFHGATAPLQSPPATLLREESNVETQDSITQSQSNPSSSWFGVVTKVVSKADNAVLSFVDRLPSISSSTRGEASGNESIIQECESCNSSTTNGVNDAPDNFIRVCIRKQCKCKCHQSPASLVQARRNHGALQRNSNRRIPLEKNWLSLCEQEAGFNLGPTLYVAHLCTYN